MIAGLVGVRDVDDNGWHLADIAVYPLTAFCGEGTPEPMRRRVRPARLLPVDDLCSWCLDVWGGGHAQELRRTS